MCRRDCSCRGGSSRFAGCLVQALAAKDEDVHPAIVVVVEERRSRPPYLRSHRSHGRGLRRPWLHAGRRSAQHQRNENRAQPICPRRGLPQASSEAEPSQVRPESSLTRGVVSSRRSLQVSSWVRISNGEQCSPTGPLPARERRGGRRGIIPRPGCGQVEANRLRN